MVRGLLKGLRIVWQCCAGGAIMAAFIYGGLFTGVVAFGLFFFVEWVRAKDKRVSEMWAAEDRETDWLADPVKRFFRPPVNTDPPNYGIDHW